MQNDAEAMQWLDARVPRETIARLEAYVALLLDENERQNLIARSTIGQIWARHIIDSAQLGQIASPDIGPWVDVGSGAGFPGIVLAILGASPITLVEPRALRVDFLRRVIGLLDLGASTQVEARKVERVVPSLPARTITARAVASIDQLLRTTLHLSGPDTTWLLSKGRTADAELEAARQSWHGEFELRPSITDSAAAIVIARNVRPRNRR